MEIFMAGIDFSRAALEQREGMAFTKSGALAALHKAAACPGAEGCVIISTCNRTELWLCTDAGRPDAARLLCGLKGQPAERSADLVSRRGAEAVRYLFEMTCGFHSLVWGEDQILAQVKEAAERSVLEGTAGKVLAKLFQDAVTTAKEVKTRVRFSQGSPSVATAAVRACTERFGSLRGLNCLVVGSGNMGFLAAEEFVSAGAEVCVTLRRYKYGVSAVPDRCTAVPYDDRLARVADADIVVSATASPHCTLEAGPVAEACAGKPKKRLFFDLAVPRDIDPAVGALPGCGLLTVDDISAGLREEEQEAVFRQCRPILDRGIAGFEKQLFAWASLPAVESISKEFAASLRDELVKQLESTGLTPEERLRFSEVSFGLLRKRSRRALFAFRDWAAENGRSALKETEPEEPASEAEGETL